ncbi:hypothetical protein PR048_016173 [Dryococelus australis]|uniref:Uncharacterized protein n=1 Tax=Dryococelus australis TaxID=614101 RepID=A0ABQ9HJK7_9NEOP|nr:hypothetical protein PR048_016173 [Dryococelus australis]
MRVIEMNMEQRRNEKAEETGDPRESPPTNGILRHDSHINQQSSGGHLAECESEVNYGRRQEVARRRRTGFSWREWTRGRDIRRVEATERVGYEGGGVFGGGGEAGRENPSGDKTPAKSPAELVEVEIEHAAADIVHWARIWKQVDLLSFRSAVVVDFELSLCMLWRLVSTRLVNFLQPSHLKSGRNACWRGRELAIGSAAATHMAKYSSRWLLAHDVVARQASLMSGELKAERGGGSLYLSLMAEVARGICSVKEEIQFAGEGKDAGRRRQAQERPSPIRGGVSDL